MDVPRPRKPTQLHVVEGTFTNHRHGSRAGEPQSNGPIGDPPAHWLAPALVLWHEFVNAMPEGVLCKADKFVVEGAVLLLIEIRSSKKVNAALMAQFRCYLAALGMTPADRSRVATSVTEAVVSDTARFFK